MASMGPPSEYSSDAARIDREYVPDRATTQAEVEAALDAAGFPEASQSHISDWIVSEEEAWDVVDASAKDAGTIETAIERESDGTVSSGRASSMGESIASDINSARTEAAQRIGDDGMVRTEDGRVIGKPSTVEEEVRSDGIYYRNTNTGTEGRAASFPNGGR